MLIPIYLQGDIDTREIERVFHAAGYHIRIDNAGRMIASRVPSFLAKAALSNIRRLRNA